MGRRNPNHPHREERFCYPEYIATELDSVFAELGHPDALVHLTSALFAEKISHFLAELNAVHPFREGNGRTQLAFLAILIEHAGFGFNEKMLDRDRVMHAMIASFSGNEAPLASLIHDLIA